MSRRTKTLLPSEESLLAPEVHPSKYQQKQLTSLKRRQVFYYNQGARDLRPLEKVRIAPLNHSVYRNHVVTPHLHLPPDLVELWSNPLDSRTMWIDVNLLCVLILLIGSKHCKKGTIIPRATHSWTRAQYFVTPFNILFSAKKVLNNFCIFRLVYRTLLKEGRCNTVCVLWTLLMQILNIDLPSFCVKSVLKINQFCLKCYLVLICILCEHSTVFILLYINTAVNLSPSWT